MNEAPNTTPATVRKLLPGDLILQGGEVLEVVEVQPCPTDGRIRSSGRHLYRRVVARRADGAEGALILMAEVQLQKVVAP